MQCKSRDRRGLPALRGAEGIREIREARFYMNIGLNQRDKGKWECHCRVLGEEQPD